MLFLLETLTWFFSMILSLVTDSSLILVLPSLFFPRLLRLPQLWSKIYSSTFCFSWSFHLSPVSVPILGSDFLCHHALLLELARSRVIDSLDVLSAVPSPSALDPFCAHLHSVPREIR